MNFNDPLVFDYSMYSKASIRYVLDELHLISTEKLDLIVVTEALDYLHFEAKFQMSEFEGRLTKKLYRSLTKMNLPMSTQLVLCCVISTMDNYDNEYEMHLGKKVSEGPVLSTVYTNRSAYIVLIL